MKSNISRSNLLKKFLNTRNLSVQITSNLSPEDNNLQVNSDVSPNKWHLGHTTWFFETFILEKYLDSYQYYNPKYLYYLNSYYQNKGNKVPKNIRHTISRPSYNEIINYRKIIDNRVLELLTKVDSEELNFMINLGLNHEQQHQELMIMDTKLNLFSGIEDSYFRKKDFDFLHKKSDAWIDFDEGVFNFGYDGDGFFYDNEKGFHKQFLHSYSISESLVTNGEYLEFINSEEYNNPNNWLNDGWNWKNQNNITKPLYWIYIDGEYFEYSINGIEILSLLKPVSHISYYEAWAYARSKSCRLPTEFELEHALNVPDTTFKNVFANVSNSFLDCIGFDKLNLFGNLWEWTNSAYLPYPFYKQDGGALGEYNGKFMNNLYVLKGGSSFTPSDHIRNTYRNFYSPEKRWVQSGFRLAKYN
ncbi:ergothioneine biosynthesis protein EgtB [Candidatus Kapabacteria bacterium]|nr:ergothioneine biosynthesis protein EgtB [Candidatus Kapabacteria bacterium]